MHQQPHSHQSQHHHQSGLAGNNQEKSFRLPHLFSRYNVAAGVDFDAPPPPAPMPVHPTPPSTTNSNLASAGGNQPPSTSSNTNSSSSTQLDAAAEAERKRLSNVERFWAEEQARKGKPRVHLGLGGASKAKKKQAYFQAPADPNHAKAMWEKMKTELDTKWERFVNVEDKESNSPNGATTERREEKEEIQAPTFKKQQTYAGPTGNTGTSRTAAAAAAAAATGATATFRSSGAAADPSEGRENIGSGAATAAAAAANRRSTAYAFTNVRKDDLKQDGKAYQYPYASAGRDSTHAYTNTNMNKAQPASTSQSYSYQPHPPSNPPPPTANAGASKPTSGAQFSSFTRPPQPHSSSSSSSSTNTNSHYFTHQSHHQPPVGSASNTSSTYSSAPHTSVPASHPHSALFDMFSRWSVKELKRELVTYGVSVLELSRLVEKEEFVAKCVRVHVEAERKAELKRAAEAKEAEKENLKDAIIHEVDRWAKGRNIKSMLNELNGCTSIETPGYLKRSDTFKEVSKAYKRALLKIHPDKHMDNESKHLRATEVFKYVSQAYQEYKKKSESGGKL